MTDQQHPITPPPELVEQWRDEWVKLLNPSCTVYQYIATQAARWGADHELEACVKWIEDCGYHPSVPEDLRDARRPQPPSLKEQALAVIENSEICDHLSPEHAAILRRALEQLDD